jgi:hypothetical protein
MTVAIALTMVVGMSSAWAQEARKAIAAVPFTITEPGSYYLTKNLVAAADQNGITVNASNVTIDLNGFCLTGPGSGKSDAITMKARSNVEVRNGTITAWGGCGVIERAPEGENHRMLNLRSTWNGESGVLLMGYNHLVKDCTCTNNGYEGVLALYGSMVTGSTLGWNTVGVNLGSGCQLVDNMIYGNVKGVWVQLKGNVIRGNTLRMNNERGIDVSGTDNVIDGNFVTMSTVGIYFGQAGNFYANNRVADCGTAFGGSVPTGAGDGGGNKSF